ncbi:MAG: polyphosphate kinase 2 family protein [Elusimicrobia bacterium]|nr:polyphosphate kinase 2 family protein [Elusimicrobiota bacterium]
MDAVAESGDFGGQFRVPYDPKGQVDLSKVDAERTPGMKHDKDKAKDRLSEDQEEMDALQQKLYAEGKRSVLIVLQAMDTAGKDGTIRWVLAGLNPQGVKVTSFKKPTAVEAKHHFLWRIKKALPGKGIIGVFNRSQYEDILVPTVYKTFSTEEVAGRYDQINAFEKKLADQGTVILKFFLHISKDEQKARLQERLDDPDKNWKFSLADLETRKRWDDFQKAYGKVLARTSTPWAPWHLIPADKKWYRNYAVGRVIKEALQRMDPRFPKVDFDPKKIKIPD